MNVLATSMAMLIAGPVAAQSPGWSFAVSPYAWVPGITASVGTTWGTVGVTKSSSDVLSKLDLAFMGAFEARKGRWGLIADLFYADLSQSRATPLGVLFSQARIKVNASALSGYAAYRVGQNERFTLDLMAGFRANSLDVNLSLSPGLLAAQRVRVRETWVDPLIGGRARVAITDRWFATAFADVGGFNAASDLTWQGLATVGYQFNERWSVQGGWRYVAIQKKMQGRDVQTDFSGPLLGLTARF